VQRAGCLDPDHRRAGAAGLDEPLELVDALAQHRQRDRLADQAALAAGQPDPVADLARIDRNDQAISRNLSEQQFWGHLSLQIEKEKDPPGSRQGRPPSTPL
jgi:hypothetical protein